MKVRLDGRAGGPENMAADLALGDGLEGWAARVYGWDGPWASLGRSQAADQALLPGAPVRWVARPTGGQGVLHGHDVTVAIAARVAEGTERQIRQVYRALVRPLANALTEAGVPAVLAEDAGLGAATSRLADCFAGTSRNDVVSPETGAKVCGCALRVFSGWALVQASVPAGPPLVDPAEVFRHAAPARWNELDPAVLVQALRLGLETGDGLNL